MSMVKARFKHLFLFPMRISSINDFISTFEAKMTRFRMFDSTQKILEALGLEYQYERRDDRIGQLHRSRFCSPDGTVILEVKVQDSNGIGTVFLKDSRGERDYPLSDVNQLQLLIINIGDTLTPSVPFIYIRVLDGRHVLHHSEYKQ